MDRRTLTRCAAVLLTASGSLAAGCGRDEANRPHASPPAVLADAAGSNTGKIHRLPRASSPRKVSLAARETAPTAADLHDAGPLQLPAGEPDTADSTLNWIGPASEPIGEHARGEELSATPAAPLELPSTPTTETATPPQEIEPPAEYTSLPWSKGNSNDPQMDALRRRADERVRHGLQLAERGALYSARSEYIAALQVIAQANDAQSGSDYFSRALAAGLLALKESSDFARQNPKKPLSNVASVVSRHRSTVLKDESVAALSPMSAAQRYYSFAQEQLAAAAARELTGSMALFGLGKTALDPAGNRGAGPLERTAHAMVYYQASLMAEPQNFRTANELGVLAAENGNLPYARDLFLKSLSLSSRPAIWHNLSAVHTRLGETALASSAELEATRLEQSGVPTNDHRVEWLAPAQFAQTKPLTDSLLPNSDAPKPPVATASAKPAEQESPVSTAKRPISDWLPWSTRR
ncbi:MAG TPA: hypothetical protein VL175_20715 [Pirellulales bacterium]|jgi:hypothetical protein|nr:hypothetical protein [Pirellulales bacterium]